VAGGAPHHPILERHPAQSPDDRLVILVAVVDEQERGQPAVHVSLPGLGNPTKKVVPSPGSDWSQIRPPCRSTIFRAMVTPTPVPPPYAVRPCNRRKIWKMLSKRLAGMPMPLSRTKITATSASDWLASEPTSTQRSGLSLYLTAFETRLTSSSW